MTTRIYCDLCGNTIRDPARFSFGPAAEFYSMQAVQNYPSQYGVVQGIAAGGYVSVNLPTYAAVQTTTQPKIAIETIDLCPRCIGTWMQRVKNITAASDPDAKPS